MFKSKTRDIIVPQSEHAQLAGIVALLWGNDQFDRPDFCFDSFVLGVALHDMGHKFFDTNEIDAMDENQSYKVDSSLVNSSAANPIANAVIHFHVRRLIMNNNSRTDLLNICETQIQNDIKASGVSRDKFIWADKITEFCDYLSFDFCFNKPSERIVNVSPKVNENSSIPINIKFDGNENIKISPWPLKGKKHEGYILGYKNKDYPKNLIPVIKKYKLHPQ